MGFRENLKTMRAAAGYETARKFAKALGIPYSRYINYEGSKSSEPPYTELVKIAKCLHVSIDELLSNKVSNDSLLLQFIRRALQETEFEFVKAEENRAIFHIKNTSYYVSVNKTNFMTNAKEEFNNAQQAMNEILGQRISNTLRLTCLNNVDLSEPEIRKVIFTTNLYNTPLKDVAAPVAANTADVIVYKK